MGGLSSTTRHEEEKKGNIKGKHEAGVYFGGLVCDYEDANDYKPELLRTKIVGNWHLLAPKNSLTERNTLKESRDHWPSIWTISVGSHYRQPPLRHGNLRMIDLPCPRICLV
ncbi:hypothetical protein ACTXT7_009316 [Hymenolepis weldensis]